MPAKTGGARSVMAGKGIKGIFSYLPIPHRPGMLVGSVGNDAHLLSTTNEIASLLDQGEKPTLISARTRRI